MYSSDQEVSRNLVAGFKKCGIYPLNVSIVLNRLPDSDKNIEIVKTNVSQAVVNVLKRLRRVDGEEKEKRKRKKKITVDPGNSISLEDFQATFKDGPIASSSLSETVIVSSELSYTPIHKTQRNEDSFYAGPVKTYQLRQKKPIGCSL